jgi:RNA polymerase sigma-70 factor (ECF subfamily)
MPDALAEDLGRAQTGDSVALQRMLASIAPEVVRVARAILGSDPSELDDAVQEALIGFVKAIGGFRGDCSVRRFAQRIATRTAIATRRRARRRSAAQQSFDDQIHDVDARSDPLRQSLSLRRQRLLRELLDALPEPQAETLALRVVLGMSLRICERTWHPRHVLLDDESCYSRAACRGQSGAPRAAPKCR